MPPRFDKAPLPNASFVLRLSNSPTCIRRRSPHGAKRYAGLSQPQDLRLGRGFRCAPSGSTIPDPASPYGLRRARVRHRPVSRPAQGTPVISCLPNAEGACGTTGRNAAPAAPALCAGSRMPFGIRRPCAFQHTGRSSSSLSRTGRRKADLACVPHAMDYSACSMSQGASLLPTLTPFVRCCRPDMHLGRPPSRRRLVPHQPLFGIAIRQKASEARRRLRTTASRCHAPATNRAAPLIGAGQPYVYFS